MAPLRVGAPGRRGSAEGQIEAGRRDREGARSHEREVVEVVERLGASGQPGLSGKGGLPLFRRDQGAPDPRRTAATRLSRGTWANRRWEMDAWRVASLEAVALATPIMGWT